MVVMGTKLELTTDTLEMTVGLSSLTTEEVEAGAVGLETNDRVDDGTVGFVDVVTTAPLLVTVLRGDTMSVRHQLSRVKHVEGRGRQEISGDERIGRTQ